MVVKVDDVIEAVGALGKFQWMVITVAGFNSLFVAPHFLAIVFHSTTPDFRCSLPAWPNDTYQPYSDIHNESIYQWIPNDEDGQLDSCRIYASNSTNNTVECTEYVFDDSVYWGTSLNMKFGLICSQTIISSILKVVFTIGLVAGAGIAGIVADRIGRKPTMVGLLLFGGISGLVTSFSVNTTMFAAFRCILAVCGVGVALVDHVVAMEFVGPSRRTTCVAYRSLFWPVGTIITSPLAYYIQDWNWFQIAISIPQFVCAIFSLVCISETPHYLVSKGKHKELTRLFRRMARINNRPVPEKLIEALKEDEEAAVTERFTAILKAPVLMKRFAVFLYLWFIAGMGFYGLNFNVANLTGDVYINNAISGAVEIPAAFAVFLAQRLGRKVLTIVPLFVGSAALVASALMSAYLDLTVYSYAQIAVSMIGKFGITIVFTLDYFWSSEVFPSTLRTTMVGFCSLSARIGTVLSPIIADLYKVAPSIFGNGLGPLIFGITMFVGGVMTLYLPETNQQKVPETIEESNRFLTDEHSKNPGNEFVSTVESIDNKTTEL